MQEQRIEAYKIYMSDSLVFTNTVLSGGKVDIPRYKDMFTDNVKPPKETAEQVIARFDKLKRKGGNPE